MPDRDPTAMLIYEQLYRPTDPSDPLPDPDTNSTTRRLWATAGRIRDALTAAGWRDLTRVSGYLIGGKLYDPRDVQILTPTEGTDE